MKLFFLLISIILLSAFSSNRENADDYRYIIFTSDSLGVIGKILNDLKNQNLYPDTPYKVYEGQRILFERKHLASANRFNITADIGKYNYFTPNNRYHYRLTNDYLIIVK